MSEAPIYVRREAGVEGVRPLLRSWLKVNRDYEKSFNSHDVPWWYNERATLSTLAGAAWRLKGWTALEEYSTEKRRGKLPKNRVESGNLRKGRCDLFVGMNSTDTLAFEVKQCWLPINRKIGGRLLLKSMSKAVKDTEALDEAEAERRIAAVFVVPYLSRQQVTAGKEKRRSAASVDERLDEWVQQIRQGDYDAFAIHRAENRIKYFSAAGNLFPTVALVLKRVK